MAKAITSSSTAEYFAKNLQQVGFSSPLKAVLTTLKEAVDNSLDACEEAGILPEITVEVRKLGNGSSKSADLIEITVEDNGPGLDAEDLPKVYGEYLASSKFGRGQCTRGQQGIGISAATTWAQLTNATGVRVTSKTDRMRKAVQAIVDVDIKQNRGVVKSKEMIDWDRPHGVRVEFRIDGRIQLNGDGGLLTYLEGTTLVNPHLKLKYRLNEADWVSIDRVSDVLPDVPPATLPHPHTMKLGEFITHAGLFGKTEFGKFLKTGFSRVSDLTLKDLVKNGIPKSMIDTPVNKLSEEQFKNAFQVIGKTELQSPSTRSVLTVGEESLAKSILRLGDVDFFSVVARKPRICDFKPVVVEVALARFLNRGSEDESIQLLRFANRVPLQFDKGACAITAAVESVNWRSYGLQQSKDSLPSGPYVFAVSVVSPFIKFKNASKETIDASDELVEEIRRALMQAGQKLSRHIRRENKEADLERKISHIEQFGPILVDGLVRISGAKESRKIKAQEGLKKLLGRDARDAEADLSEAEVKLAALKEKQAKAGLLFSTSSKEDVVESEVDDDLDEGGEDEGQTGAGRGTGKAAAKAAPAVKGTTAKVVEKPAAKPVATTGKDARGTEKVATTTTTGKDARGTDKSARK
ncbi:MAG: DNA topoisomerase VI subunit B [Bdellovibrionaceae bacterium]|nr:DNA topoisomerase VI subunit B [Pseudobdellovibrionaceae bacterium]